MSESETRTGDLFRRYPVYWKLAMLAVMALASLFPLERIRDLILEREFRQASVAAEIKAAWGGDQKIVGPVLILPVDKAAPPTTTEDGDILERRWPDGVIYVLPADLTIEADLDVETKRRGIYETPVYTAETTLRGHFAVPDLDSLGIEDAVLVRWSEATIEVYIADLASVLRIDELNWDETMAAFQVGRRIGDQGAKLVAAPSLSESLTDWNGTFEISLAGNGTSVLGFQPLGRTTSIAVRADWPHPSFAGAFLPTQTEIDDQGFAASWQVSGFARPMPQQWRSTEFGLGDVYTPDLDKAATLRLVDPVDHYLKSERAAKYGLLFVALVFGAVFIFEATTGGRIHVIQYGMVAAALCLFFLLLVSLSEVLGFTLAYWIAAAAALSLIAWYLAKCMASYRHGMIVATLLAAVYGYLFSTLQSEDRALLLGSLLLFAALGAAMVATRNVDWYRLGDQARRRSDSQPLRSDQA